MPRYDQLAITALRINPEAPPKRDYYLLRFPGKWKRPLRRLAQAQRGGDVASIPIASLNDAVAALIPDTVVTLTRAGQGDEDQDWVLAYRAINPIAILNLVAAWVRAQNAPSDQIAATLAELSADDLVWSTLTVDLMTPEHARTALRLAAMEAAAVLSQPGTVCPYGNLSFRRCSADDGAEVISWPPERIEEQTPFSVLVRISTQTLPDAGDPLVYLTFGVRRWMPVKAKLSFDHGHNVYLAPTVPYLTGLENSRSFGRARVRRVRRANLGGEAVYVNDWDDQLAQVLREAGCLDRLPDPQQLTDKPMDYLQREGDAAALVYSTGMLSSRERVSAGLSLADRQPLMEWAAEMLAPHLLLHQSLPRVPRPTRRAISTTSDDVVTRLPPAINDVVGDRLDIELHTDTQAATAYALDALSTRLGSPMPSAEQIGDQPTLIAVGPLTVGVCRPSLRIATALDRDAAPGGRVTSAVEARIAQITSRLPKASHPTIALVEIDGLDIYTGARRREDPKFAVRHGLLRTGRLSQFITPVTEPKPQPRSTSGDREPADPNRERFREAIVDLFRQLGVRPEPLPPLPTGTIDRAPALLGLWIIRQNKGKIWGVSRQVPVALLIDPTGQHIRVRAPQVDWQPIHTGHIEIGKRYINADLKYGPTEVMGFIQQVISDVIQEYTETLLLTHAQNLRTMWPSISNKNISLDTLGFGSAEPQPIADFPGLRHIRVRTNDGGETPQCFGTTENDSGQPQGLWQFGHERLFASTGAKPSTAASALKGLSKLVPQVYGDKLQPPRPNKQVWNQHLVEILVAGLQKGDQAEDWAALAHDLRSAAPYFDATTILPWPLHLAQQIEEYLLPVKVNYVADEDSGGTE